MAHSRLVLAACVFALGACASPKPAEAPSQAQPSWSDNTEWQAFHSKRFRLWVSFPEGKSWRIDDHRGSSLVASHEASKSSVGVSVFGVPSMLNPRDCEREAIAMGLLDKAPVDAPVEELRIDGTPALIRVVASERAAQMGGSNAKVARGELRTLVSIGRECVVLQYQTEGQSSDIAPLSARMAAVRARMIPSLRFDTQRTGVGADDKLRAP